MSFDAWGHSQGNTGEQQQQLLGAPDAEVFRECARLIAKDVPRTFPSEASVDRVRLRIADVLREYARRDVELGYVQGMCFAAAGACISTSSLSDAGERFEALMSGLRPLWLPGFPMVQHGLPLLEEILCERDPELFQHLLGVGLDFLMVIPSAWLSVLAKWVPLGTFLELLPLLSREGLLGLLAATLLLLLFHRDALIHCWSLEDVLDFLGGLASKEPPDRLLEMCEASLPALRPALRQRAGRLGLELAAAALGVRGRGGG